MPWNYKDNGFQYVSSSDPEPTAYDVKLDLNFIQSNTIHLFIITNAYHITGGKYTANHFWLTFLFVYKLLDEQTT